MAANALLIATAHRTVTDTVPAPPAAVRAFYVDLDNIALVHPLVISVQSLGRTVQPGFADGGGEAGAGYVEEYRVRDRIPVGKFALNIRYAVRLSVPATGNVIAESRQFPAVRLHTTVSFDATDNGTRVTERMQITAPRPLLGLTVGEAVDAHATMLAGIARHFS
jgi:hypothetical protein